MPEQEQRYIEYLGNYRFFPNSIQFRIVSSKALEKFKNVQAFQLNQLINGNFFFAQDRREILLLKYDMWSRWLIEVENYVIEHHDNTDEILDYDIKFIVALAEKTTAKYKSIITEEHGHHFDTKFAKIWLEVHEASFEALIREFKKLKGTFDEVFVTIVDLLVGALQYTLVEIHELNEMFKHPHEKTAFITFCDFSSFVFANHHKSLAAGRIEIYKKYFDFDTVWIKNYTDVHVPPSLIEAIEASGVTIDFKRSLINK